MKSEKVTDLYWFISKKLKFVVNNWLSTFFFSYTFLLLLSLLSTSKCTENLCTKEDDLVVFVNTPESHKQKLSKQKIKISQKQFFYHFFNFYSFNTVKKEKNTKMEANTNADQLKEMQLREKIRYKNRLMNGQPV